jgi:hypothetical protein
MMKQVQPMRQMRRSMKTEQYASAIFSGIQIITGLETFVIDAQFFSLSCLRTSSIQCMLSTPNDYVMHVIFPLLLIAYCRYSSAVQNSFFLCAYALIQYDYLLDEGNRFEKMGGTEFYRTRDLCFSFRL